MDKFTQKIYEEQLKDKINIIKAITPTKGVVTDDISKGKSYPIGTIHNGYKKIANGKWVKVSDKGLTKKEHTDKVNELASKKGEEFGYNFHLKHSSKLDYKEYNDDDVLKEDINKGILSFEEDIQKAINVCGELLGGSAIDDIEKAMGHKYFKREGTPGNYKYYYTEEQYKKEKEGKVSSKITDILYPLHSNAKGFLYHSDGTRVSNASSLKKLNESPNKLVSILDIKGTNGEEKIDRSQMGYDNINASYTVRAAKGGGYKLVKEDSEEGVNDKGERVHNIDGVGFKDATELKRGDLAALKDGTRVRIIEKISPTKFVVQLKSGERRNVPLMRIESLKENKGGSKKEEGNKKDSKTEELKKKFSELIDEGDSKFFAAVGEIAPPEDDGESESALLERLGNLPSDKQKDIIEMVNNPSNRKESETKATKNESVKGSNIVKIMSNPEDWGEDAKDVVYTKGDNMVYIDSFYYGEEKAKKSLVSSWSPGGTYYEYFINEHGIKPTVVSNFSEMQATGLHKKLTKDGVVGVELSFEKV